MEDEGRQRDKRGSFRPLGLPIAEWRDLVRSVSHHLASIDMVTIY